MHSRAMVLFSGGQDSTTCLAWALERYTYVETVGFDYGQRHAVELACRPSVLAGLRELFPKWSSRLGEDHVAKLDVLKQLGETALTEEVEITMGANGLPTTFVPGRNLMFVVTAAALAYRRGITALVAGVCETDFSGYPDCRDDTIKAIQLAVNLGMERRFVIETPLMWIDKAATWQLAKDLGGDALVRLIVERTHTCYKGQRDVVHDWGFGCGACPACELRLKGFRRYVEQSAQ